MFRIRFVFAFACFLVVSKSYSQEKKKVRAEKIEKGQIKIDGKLDESVWAKAQNAEDFVMLEPGNGDPEPQNQKSKVKILYDNEAIYFGAYLYDDDPESIPMQFTARDEFGMADYFGVALNPNNDGINEWGFVVMATGTQADLRVQLDNDDLNWNAVWDSDVSLVDDGWIVEIRIPYAMLRFDNQEVQTWGVNFFRGMQDTRSTYTWNFIDKTKGYGPQYAGLLEGIENLKPPVRLSFYPYGTFYYGNNPEDGSSTDFSLGLDVKYGLSEAFTLDVTLIPDFGQTRYDNVVLNLGPFEQRYDEQRAFFTEGTELFNKGRLFYSRRIGSRPTGYWSVEEELRENEIIVDNPENVQMLNALKLSGRDKKGLAVGFFNAITEKTYATVEDENTGEQRSILTEPFTNYNVFVVDKQFNGNSSFGLLNTNVTRVGDFRDANATAVFWDLANRKNTYKVEGNMRMSYVNDQEDKWGYNGYLGLQKISGNVQARLGNFWGTEDYDITDLGFQRQRNYNNFFSEVSYRIFEPWKNLNQFRVSFEPRLSYLFEPFTYTGNNFEFDTFATTKKNFSFGLGAEFEIGDQYDYNEAREFGRFVTYKPMFSVGGFISSDYNKFFAIDANFNWGTQDSNYRYWYELGISPRFKFTDRFLLIYQFQKNLIENELGYVTTLDNGDIIMGDRDSRNVVNGITANYNFNAYNYFSLSFRHYWAPVSYDLPFYTLNLDGSISPNDYGENEDVNFNVWNTDVSYNWQFKPGSNLIFLYRNAISKEDQLSSLPFDENLKNLLQEGMNHVFSIRLIYFLDYNSLKK